MNLLERIKGCLAGGALGDSIGSFYESQPGQPIIDLDTGSGISDDTQLTIATCESILERGRVSPEHIERRIRRCKWPHSNHFSGSGNLTFLSASTISNSEEEIFLLTAVG